MKSRLGSVPKIPLVTVIAAITVGILANSINGTILPEESAIDLSHGYSPPWPLEGSSLAHPLGTDRLGRDVASRLVKGAELSLGIAFAAIFFGATVGTGLGLISGFAGAWVDSLIMRVVDIMLSFPAILVAMTFVATVGASLLMVVSIIGFLLWPHFARLVRSEVLSLRERDFIASARAVGASDLRIVMAHIIPNLFSTVLVLGTLQMGWVIVVEASLSFLGAGVPPPTPTWGNMVAEGREVIRSAWWIALFPGAAIASVVLAFNLLGDWLRDTLDPRLRGLLH